MLIVWCIAPPQINAQALYGTTQLTLTTGHQTNAYNDAMLRSWDPRIAPAFVGLTPQAMVSWNGPRFRTHLRTLTRWDVRADLDGKEFATAFPLMQSDGRVLYALTDALELGVSGGARHYRLQTDQDGAWMLPTVQWNVTDALQIDGYAGVTAQRSQEEEASSSRWQSTLIAQSSARWWVRDDLRTTLRVYGSQGTLSIAEGSVQGTGGELASTWWPTPTWSISVQAKLNQNRYVLDVDGASPPGRQRTATQTTRLVQTGIEATWQPTSSVDVFVQTAATQVLDNNRESSGASHHVAAGLRLRSRSVLAGSSRLSVSGDQLWVAEGTTVHVSIPASDDAQLYLTGDFNGWELPGIPLTPTGNGRHETMLELPPGEHAYRVHKADDDVDWDTERPNWIDLPRYAANEKDAFGGTNGVITVNP